MNKIIKVITLLTLITCLTPTSSIVFANCPRESKNKVYEKDGDCVWEYYNHDTIKRWYRRDNERKAEITAAAAGAAAIIAFFNAGVGGVVAGVSTGLIAVSNGHAKKWVEDSEDNDSCGVKIKYCYNMFKQLYIAEHQPQ